MILENEKQGVDEYLRKLQMVSQGLERDNARLVEERNLKAMEGEKLERRLREVMEEKESYERRNVELRMANLQGK